MVVQTTSLQRKDDSSTAVKECASQQKTSISVYTLATELLLQIFAEYQANVRDNYQSIVVSHVSRHWRNVSVNDQMLWSSIFLPTHPEILSMFLDRSRDAPLTVFLDRCQHIVDMPERFHRIMEHTHRIKSFHLSGLSLQSGLEEAIKLLHREAPLLETLLISGSFLGPETVNPHTRLPDILLHNRAARLRRLEITGCSFRWGSTSPRTLRHLRVANINGTSPTMAEMIHFLKGLPLLETLDIEKRVSHFAWRNPTGLREDVILPLPSTTAELRRLHSFRLIADNLYCAAILDHLNLPSLSSIRLICNPCDGTSDLMSALAIKVTVLKEISSINICGMDEGQTQIQFKYQESLREFNVTFQLRRAPFALPLTPFEASNAAAASLARLFAHMDQVSTLRVSGSRHAGPAIMPALAECFPELRALELEDVHFTDRISRDRDPERLMGALVGSLEWRRASGIELQKLRLTRCFDLGRKEVERLREVVASVVWDGEADALDREDI